MKCLYITTILPFELPKMIFISRMIYISIMSLIYMIVGIYDWYYFIVDNWGLSESTMHLINELKIQPGTFINATCLISYNIYDILVIIISYISDISNIIMSYISGISAIIMPYICDMVDMYSVIFCIMENMFICSLTMNDYDSNIINMDGNNNDHYNGYNNFNDNPNNNYNYNPNNGPNNNPNNFSNNAYSQDNNDFDGNNNNNMDYNHMIDYSNTEFNNRYYNINDITDYNLMIDYSNTEFNNRYYNIDDIDNYIINNNNKDINSNNSNPINNNNYNSNSPKIPKLSTMLFEDTNLTKNKSLLSNNPDLNVKKAPISDMYIKSKYIWPGNASPNVNHNNSDTEMVNTVTQIPNDNVQISKINAEMVKNNAQIANNDSQIPNDNIQGSNSNFGNPLPESLSEEKIKILKEKISTDLSNCRKRGEISFIKDDKYTAEEEEYICKKIQDWSDSREKVRKSQSLAHIRGECPNRHYVGPITQNIYSKYFKS